MSPVAIVAIPAKDDYVWNISSEKVPHMTLLTLGDSMSSEIADRVEAYLDHAVLTSLRRFGMSVDRRGTLGDMEADVLFFEKNWAQDVKDFIGFLLQDPNIKTGFDSMEQFEGWTPHLTLGYPESPAKPDPRDYPGIDWVQFDRIAFWTGDYSGPEFELGAHDSMEIAMHEMTLEEVMAHYGVKGMKWGVRKDRGHEGERAKTKQIARLDRAFAFNAKSLDTSIKIHNHAAKLVVEKDLPRINAKPEYRKAAKDGDLNRRTPIRQQYYKETQDALVNRLKETADEIGTNASGTKKYEIEVRKDGQWYVNVVDVKHADIGPMRIDVSYGADGLITNLVPVEEAMSHYGIKGMKWGVRKERQSANMGGQTKAEVKSSPESSRAKELKKRPLHSLSNHEIKQLNERLRLEQEFNRLNPDVVKKGSDKAHRLLSTLDTVNRAVKVLDSPAGKLAITIGTGIAAKRIAGKSSDAFIQRLKEGI